MPGVLKFALGLDSTKFLANARRALGAIGALTGASVSFGAAMAGVGKAIQEGGRLFDLSRRTGEGVANLFKLQHAFADVGVEASNVSPLILQMQKAIGGRDEAGQPTNDTFARLGLSIEELKSLNAPAQITAITAALAKFPKDEASSLASKIFGRGGAGDALQIARSADDFASALQKAAPVAEVFARNAAAFDKIGDTLGELRMKSKGLFAGIAEGAAPAIQQVLDKLNNLDLTAFGKRIGEAIQIGFIAFDQGKLGDLVALSLKAGIQDASNFMLDQIDLWAVRVQQAMSGQGATGAGFWKKVGAGTLGAGAGLLGLWNLIGEKLGVPGAAGKAEERIAQAERLFGKAGLGGGLLSDIAGAGGPLSRTNPFTLQLAELIASLRGGFGPANVVYPGYPNGLQGGGGGGLISLGGAAGRSRTMDVNDLERVGLVTRFFDKGNNPAQRTANGIESLVKIQQRAFDVIKTYLPRVVGPNPITTGPFINIR